MSLRTMRVEQEVRIAAGPERVFEALTREVGAWWGPPNTYDEAPRDIVLEPVVGGRFYEESAEGGALYATVRQIRRPSLLVLVGPMGMRTAEGVVTFALEPDGGATRLRLTHWAMGELDDASISSYANGWRDLLDRRLRALLERGERLGVRR